MDPPRPPRPVLRRDPLLRPQAHPDIPRAVLTARRALLADSGVAERRPYAPGRFEHVLTDAGVELWPVAHGLMQWGERHLAADAPVRVSPHAACGAAPGATSVRR